MDRPSLPSLLRTRRDEHPEARAILFGDRVITWSEYAECSFRMANALSAWGVEPGDRVAIMMPNCPEYLFAYLGIVGMGAAPVPVNVAQRGLALAHILADSDARAIIIDGELWPAYQDVVGELESPPLVIVMGAERRGAIPFDRAMDADASFPEITLGSKSGLGILYTSGTTGPPKGVVATGYDMTPFDRLLDRFKVEAGETIYTALPLFHGNALIISAIGSMHRDWTLALAAKFSASRFWDDIRKYGAVEFNALGAIMPILLKQPARANDRDNPVRTVLSAACPEWAWREFETRFGVSILEFYGLVDHPGLLVNDDGTPGQMGRAIGPTEFEVHNSDEESVVDEIGELVMRHPNGRLTHYHKQPEATEKAFRNGWFHTGDLAIVDRSGSFTYAGRLKESMRRRGENISAWEIESVVNRHPGVLECAAHAVESPLGEDDVKLVVVLQDGISLDPEQIVEFCEGKMAPYAVPTYVEFRAQLPKTGTQRIQYAVLKAEGITPTTWSRLDARG